MPERAPRIAVLTLLAAAFIAITVPLRAYSAEPLGESRVASLVDSAAPPPAGVERGQLSGRDGLIRGLPTSISVNAESLTPTAPPTPPSIQLTPQVRAVPTPRPTPRPVVSTTVDGSVWDRLAQCESGGNWSINTGNGYYGGLQFNLSTWQAYGGGEFAAYPHQATREEQIIVAERLHAVRGFQPWPACRIKLGLP